VNTFRAIFSRLGAEWQAQWLGRRALREVRFAKYTVTPGPGDHLCRERVLRRLPRNLRMPSWSTTTWG
jgi:hypothetical protein